MGWDQEAESNGFVLREPSGYGTTQADLDARSITGRTAFTNTPLHHSGFGEFNSSNIPSPSVRASVVFKKVGPLGINKTPLGIKIAPLSENSKSLFDSFKNRLPFDKKGETLSENSKSVFDDSNTPATFGDYEPGSSNRHCEDLQVEYDSHLLQQEIKESSATGYLTEEVSSLGEDLTDSVVEN